MNTATATKTATTLAKIVNALDTQLAIRAVDFGQLIGLDSRQTALAVNQNRLGVETFQVVERGRHMVSSENARAFLTARGIKLPAGSQQ